MNTDNVDNDNIIIDDVVMDHPKVYKIIKSTLKGNIDILRVVNSPNGNCQSFSILYAYNLLESFITDEDIKYILRKLVNNIGKPQCILDLNVGKAERILARLSPYIIKEVHLPYDNANGSSMILYIITLNFNKILS